MIINTLFLLYNYLEIIPILVFKFLVQQVLSSHIKFILNKYIEQTICRH